MNSSSPRLCFFWHNILRDAVTVKLQRFLETLLVGLTIEQLLMAILIIELTMIGLAILHIELKCVHQHFKSRISFSRYESLRDVGCPNFDRLASINNS